MTFSKPVLITLLFLASACLATAQIDELKLPETVFPSLEGILQTALQQSPQMISQTLNLDAASGGYLQAKAGMLPNLSGSYQPSKTRDHRADLTYPVDTTTLYYNVTLTQPLYHWGSLRNNARIGELQLKIAQRNYADAYRLLAQEIRAEYMGLIIKKIQIAKQQFTLKQAQDGLALAEDKLQKHLIGAADLFGPQMNLRQAQLAVDQADEDYAYSKRSFMRLAGLTSLDESAIPDEIPTVANSSGTLAGLLGGFLAEKDPDTYTLQNLRDQITQQDLNYRNAKNRLRPNLDLILGENETLTSYSLNIAARYQVRSDFIGVRVSWSIFDGFATRGAVRQTLAQRRQLERSYRDAVAALSDQAQNQFKQVDFAYRNMQITDLYYGSAKAVMAQRQGDYKRGLISEADLNAGKGGLYDSEISAFSARADYLNKLCQFLSLMQDDPALNNLPHAKS